MEKAKITKENKKFLKFQKKNKKIQKISKPIFKNSKKKPMENNNNNEAPNSPPLSPSNHPEVDFLYKVKLGTENYFLIKKDDTFNMCIPQLLTKMENLVPEDATEQERKIPKNFGEYIRISIKDHITSVRYFTVSKQNKKEISIIDMKRLVIPIENYLDVQQTKMNKEIYKKVHKMLSTLTENISEFKASQELLEREYSEEEIQKAESEIRIYNKGNPRSTNAGSSKAPRPIEKKKRSPNDLGDPVKKIHYENKDLTDFSLFVSKMKDKEINIENPFVGPSLRLIEATLEKEGHHLSGKFLDENASLLLSVQAYLSSEKKNPQICSNLKGLLDTIADNS